MGKPWLKLWTDTLSDRKLRRLAPEQKWCWIGLLLLAAETDKDGKIELAEGVPMIGEDFIGALDVEPETWESAYSYFLRMGMVVIDGDGFVVIVNYTKRQEPTDPTAAERMRRYRNKDRTAPNVTRDNTVTVTAGDDRNVTRNVTPMLRVEVEVEAEADINTTHTTRAHTHEGDDEKAPPSAYASEKRTDAQQRIMRLFQDTFAQTIWSSEKRVAWLDEMTAGAGEERMKQLIEELAGEVRAGRLIAYNALGALSERLKATQNGRQAPTKKGADRFALNYDPATVISGITEL